MENSERDQVIEELMSEHPVNDLISFTEYNLQEKLQNNALLVVKYTELYLKEKSILDKIAILRDKITCKKYDYYRFNFEKELQDRIIEKYYLPADPEVIKISKLYLKQSWTPSQ